MTRLSKVHMPTKGTKKINEPPQSSKGKRAHVTISNYEDSLGSGLEPPASRDMTQQPNFSQCEFVLTGRAVNPYYELYLPSTLELLSTNTFAIVRSTKLQKAYLMRFSGKQKRFGVKTWKRFVEDHELRAGHRLRFKVVERSQTAPVIEVYMLPHHRPWFQNCDLVLTNREVKPEYELHVPARLRLPRIDMLVLVRSIRLQKDYMMMMTFDGMTNQFDVPAWKKFVKDHKLRKEDRLEFNVVSRGKTSWVIEVSTTYKSK